jgi:hypothetical protein
MGMLPIWFHDGGVSGHEQAIHCILDLGLCGMVDSAGAVMVLVVPVL